MVDLTYYTNNKVSLKARVSWVHNKITSVEKRKLKRDKTYIPKSRVFILEDVRTLKGKLLMPYSFIRVDNIDILKQVRVGDTIYFDSVNIFAFGKPVIEHDSVFNLLYSHAIEYDSSNIKSVSSGDTVTYLIEKDNKYYGYECAYIEKDYLKYKDSAEYVKIFRNIDDVREYMDIEKITEKSFNTLLRGLDIIEEGCKSKSDRVVVAECDSMVIFHNNGDDCTIGLCGTCGVFKELPYGLLYSDGLEVCICNGCKESII